MKSLILVAIRGQITKTVFGPAIPEIIQAERSKLKNSGNWINWRFEVRTPEGYKNKPILNRK